MNTSKQGNRINRTMGAGEWTLIIILSLLWGASFFFVEVAVQTVPLFSLVLVRVGLAALVLWGFVLATGRKIPRAKGIWGGLLILGAMLDIFSAIIIMVPLMLPVALEYGIHPVHLGIIFLANMQIGYFTPPVGMNLFIAGYRFDKPIHEIYRATIPFMLVLLLSVLIITYWPQLSLFLIS